MYGPSRLGVEEGWCRAARVVVGVSLQGLGHGRAVWVPGMWPSGGAVRVPGLGASGEGHAWFQEGSRGVSEVMALGPIWSGGKGVCSWGVRVDVSCVVMEHRCGEWDPGMGTSGEGCVRG